LNLRILINQLQVVQIQKPARLKSLCANKENNTTTKNNKHKKNTSQKTDEGLAPLPQATAVLPVACCPC
jgi:hypothetical protein